ncbi:MAG: prephenate dehydratase [Chitinophagales bacterium]
MRIKRVAIQGIEASFHDVAARKYFGEHMQIVACNSFRSSCEKLLSDEADYCVMAIENSIAGSILTNYNIISDFRLRIIGELYMQIELHLMGLNGIRMEEMEQIHSHTMAIRQCEDFLLQYPNIKVLALNDTAECARNVSEQKLKRVGVIAGEACAKRFNLSIITRNIETHKKNYTRFIILSAKSINVKGANKASISFQLDNSPRSLQKVVDVFGDHSINMTKIQSVPIIGRPSEYTFLMDLEWKDFSKYERAMAKVMKNTFHLSLLGEYRKGKFVTSKP